MYCNCKQIEICLEKTLGLNCKFKKDVLDFLLYSGINILQ